ncbi:hypothetical protein [Streptomonospora arabica]|uniref:Lipopolysaccharide assembly protein A domain-containing protein n=1 Tax=Streptomonospora arabica TaxID=412417 RepID=A0ABV9SSR4_9ACTN
METLSAGATAAATLPGVETVLSALPLSPAEWLWLLAFAVIPGLLAGACSVVSRWRRPREEMTARLTREAREHRAAQAGDS